MQYLVWNVVEQKHKVAEKENTQVKYKHLNFFLSTKTWVVTLYLDSVSTDKGGKSAENFYSTTSTSPLLKYYSIAS